MINKHKEIQALKLYNESVHILAEALGDINMICKTANKKLNKLRRKK
jgi:hypothetical protein